MEYRQVRLGQVRSGHTSHWAGSQSHGQTRQPLGRQLEVLVRIMVHTVKLFPQSRHTWSILRLGQGTRPTGQAVGVVVWLGLESWSAQLNCSLRVITHGVSLGQVRLGQGTRPTGQAVRVMVWLGLESWSTRLNCSLGVITRGLSLGQVRLGQCTLPTGQAVRVMVWLWLESWSTRLNCSLGVNTHGESLGQVMLGQGTRPTGQAVRVMVWLVYRQSDKSDMIGGTVVQAINLLAGHTITQLGLESWSTRLNCSLGVITCGVSLGQVRLGQGTRPTRQAVRVIARHVSNWPGGFRYRSNTNTKR